MPLTKSGEKVMRSMMKQYGSKKGKGVFYASINAGKRGSQDWHAKRKKEMMMSELKKRTK